MNLGILNSPVLFLILYIWSIAWKGVALWRAANLKQRNWFIAILVLNTIGILEILYLFKFAKKQLTFKEMYKKAKGWKFVIAVSINEGDEAAFEELKKKAKSAPIEFVVNSSNNDLWTLYSKAKIYWHASGLGENLEEHPEFAEHFGISTVEAMGGGAVPVVINAGGQKEIVEDGFSGFLWNTLDELQEKTLTLIQDSDILEKMSENAKKRSKDFAGDRFSEEVKRMIDNG